MRRREAGGPDERGASEIIGVVLLFGLVIAGTLILLVSGGVLQDKLSEQQHLESAEDSMKQLDAGMGSMARANGEASAREFVVTDRGAETVTIERGDTLSLSVADDPACTATVPLDAIRYDLEGENSVVYQAGGVWKVTESGTSVASPPDISFRNGSIDLSVAELRGEVDQRFTARKNTSASRTMTTDTTETLFYGADDCRRPDGLTITINSEQYDDVWYQYLAAEMPTEDAHVSVDHDPADDEVTFTLDQKALPEESDDRRNTVVNFSGGGMSAVGDSDGDGDVEARIDKPDDDDNEYTASVTYLGGQGGTETVEEDNEVENPRHWHEPKWDNETVPVLVPNDSTTTGGTPMEVTLLFDESGSMAQPCLRDPGDINQTCRDEKVTRLDKVKDASEHFLAKLEAGELDHRAALISYTTRYGGYSREFHGLTGDIDDVRSRVDDLEPGGNTPIGDGIWASRVEYGDNHESGHDKVIILLTDGKHNDGTAPLPKAVGANREGITIHTIGVGDDVNRGTLTAIAHRTGGEHHFVDSAGELTGVFNEILANETPGYDVKYETRVNKTREGYVHEHDGTIHIDRDHQVVRMPVTVEMAVDGGPSLTPWVDGSTTVERALNYRRAGVTPDGMTIEDGQTVEFDATVHECDEKRRTGRHKHHGGNTYNVTECSTVGSAVDGEQYTYTDGDPIPDDNPHWWQRPVEEMVPGKYLDDTDDDGDPERFDLDSNQVIVVSKVDVTGSPHEYHSAAFLFEAGRADEEVTTDWMLSLIVNVVESDS